MRRAGFSLIEVLVAFAILAIGASSALAIFAAATRAHRRAIDRVRTALLAEAVVSAVRSELRDGVPIEAVAKRVEAQAPGAPWPDYASRFELRPLEAAGANPAPMPRVLVRVWVKRRKGQDEPSCFETILLPRADWRRKDILGPPPRLHARRGAVRRD